MLDRHTSLLAVFRLVWITLPLTLAAGSSFAEIDARALREEARALFGALTPAANANVDPEVAQLGRALFFDTRIAPDGKTGCISCHLAEDWGSDRRAFSPDARGRLTDRHSQTVFNAADQPTLRWRGDRRSAAHQAEDSLVGSMGFASVDAVVPVLKARGYEAAFRKAFPRDPQPVSPKNWGVALQEYQRTLVTPAPFDDFLNGNDMALTSKQLRGLRLFVDTGCASCHSGSRLGGDGFQRFGLTRNYWEATGSKKIDMGRYAITKEEIDRYVFRVPMLRNIAKTAPYFHDGSVSELTDAVRIMAALQLGRELEASASEEIASFLEALTGEVPAHYAEP